MALSRDEVLHIAKLARVGVTHADVDRLSAQLSGILDHFETLQQLDTEGVEATSYPLPLLNVMRDDTTRPSLPREAVLQNAPGQNEGFFQVSAVLE